jgi:hypothetical protein
VIRDAIILVSGSPEFLEQVDVLLQGRAALFLLGTHQMSKCPPPPGPARFWLSHQSLGSPTHFLALFGCQGVPIEIALHQSVGRIFDFGVHPDPLDALDLLDKSAAGLSIDGILHPIDLTRPIVQQMSFYRSGWGLGLFPPMSLGLLSASQLGCDLAV